MGLHTINLVTQLRHSNNLCKRKNKTNYNKLTKKHQYVEF